MPCTFYYSIKKHLLSTNCDLDSVLGSRDKDRMRQITLLLMEEGREDTKKYQGT